jgi:hypothetical protein
MSDDPTPPPMGYGAPEPDLAGDVPEDDKGDRVVNDGESCVVDDREFFLKGSIEIPVIGLADPFVWTVWAKLSEEDFVRSLDQWHEPARAEEAPVNARLGTALPVYPPTLDLPIRVHTRAVGKRPRIEIVSTHHPLTVEQRDGITLERVREIAARIQGS